MAHISEMCPETDPSNLNYIVINDQFQSSNQYQILCQLLIVEQAMRWLALENVEIAEIGKICLDLVAYTKARLVRALYSLSCGNV